MAISTTVTLANGLPIYWEREFLAMAKPILVHYQMAQRGRVLSLPDGTGTTVYWTRYLPLAKRTTTLTETTTGGITAGKAISDMRVSAAVEYYGDWVEIGHKIEIAYIDQGVKGAVDLIGRQMGESVDYIVMDVIHGGDYAINRIRADNDATYTKDLVDDGGGSTTEIHDADGLNQTDDVYVGAFAICTDESSKAYGEVREITDSTSTGGEVLVGTAFSATMASMKYRVVASDGLAAAGDNFGSTPVRYGVRELKRRKALKFADGNFGAILPIDNEFDFMGDTTWVHVAEYQDKTPIMEGEIGRWMGVRFNTPSTEGDWREAAATMGTIDATGAVYCAPFFGKEAIGVVPVASQPQKVYIRSWEELGQKIPIYSTVGWEVGFVAKVLNGLFAVDVMCSATA